MKKEYCVYVHTNKTNGKKYVGITSMNPERRWSSGRGYRSNPYFSRAIEKYGWDGFKHEIVFSGITKEEAYKKEIQLISELDLTNTEHGYNLDKGGNGSNRVTNKTRKKLSNGMKRYLKEHPEAKQANVDRLRELSKSNTGERLRKYQSENPDWSVKHGLWLKNYYKEHPEKRAEHSAKLKNHYAEHPELRELKSKQTKSYFKNHPEARAHAAQKTREYYRNPKTKRWKSEERKRFFAKHPEKKPTKPIDQYTLDGVFVKSWDSGMDAETIGGYSRKQISACVTGRQRTACGFVWRYKQ